MQSNPKIAYTSATQSPGTELGIMSRHTQTCPPPVRPQLGIMSRHTQAHSLNILNCLYCQQRRMVETEFTQTVNR